MDIDNESAKAFLRRNADVVQAIQQAGLMAMIQRSLQPVLEHNVFEIRSTFVHEVARLLEEWRKQEQIISYRVEEIHEPHPILQLHLTLANGFAAMITLEC